MTNIPDSIYKEAWQVLYACLGERMQDEEMELMDAVLQSVKSDYEEHEKWLTEQKSSNP